MSIGNSPLTYIIILANLFFSYQGFRDANYLDKNAFLIGSILKKKEYRRLLSSGFVHANWSHLLFNMFSFYSFGESLELAYGSFFLGIIYFASLIGGDLLSLFIHRKDANYSAIGASGAVSGIIFASVVLFPEMEIHMFPLPFGIPSWAFAVLYTLYSIYGMRAQNDNTGHDAHLGGAIIGMLVCIGFHPDAFALNMLLISAVLIPTCIFMFILVAKPHLLDGKSAPKKKVNSVSDEHYNQIRAEKQKEMDRILEKINAEGMESLSDYEKRFLSMNK